MYNIYIVKANSVEFLEHAKKSMRAQLTIVGYSSADAKNRAMLYLSNVGDWNIESVQPMVHPNCLHVEYGPTVYKPFHSPFCL